MAAVRLLGTPMWPPWRHVDKNEHIKFFWACKNEHPQQTIVLTKTAAQQPCSGHFSFVVFLLKIALGWHDRHNLIVAVLNAILSISEEDLPKKTRPLLFKERIAISMQWIDYYPLDKYHHKVLNYPRHSAIRPLNNSGLGPVSRKSRKLFGPEKSFVKLRPAIILWSRSFYKL